MSDQYPNTWATPSEGEEELPRSPLFSISPRGLGTWRVESLGSYVNRLALAHQISQYRLKKLVWGIELGEETSLRPGSLDTQIYAHTLGGLGSITATWVAGLNQLLHSTRTSETSLQALSGQVAVANLLSRIVRHCPICSRENLGGGGAYEYLLWRISAVMVCPLHECALEAALPAAQYRRGHWRYVETALVRPRTHLTPRAFSDARLASEVQRAKLVAAFLESPSFHQGLGGKQLGGVRNFLRGAIQQLTGGVASHLARHLHVPKGGFHGWLTGGHLPTFEQVLHIAQGLDCSLEAMLTGDISQFPLMLPEYVRQQPTASRRELDVKGAHFQAHLKETVNSNKQRSSPLSLAELARILGVDRTQLRLAYPDLSVQVSEKYQQWRIRKAEMVKAIRHHAYREAALTIAKAGVLPTRNRVMRLLENVSVFSRDDMKVCQMICYEVRDDFHLKGLRDRPKET